MKVTILSFTLLLSLLFTGCFKGEGQVRVASDRDGVTIFVDGDEKVSGGKEYTTLILEEGKHEIKVEKLSDDGEWLYRGIKTVIVGENTSQKVDIDTSREATEKRKERLAKEKAEREARLAKEKAEWNRIKNDVIKHKGYSYKMVKSPYTGKIWLDRNLGASRVCTSTTDSKCYGDYFQWGRNADGHEKKNSSTTSSLSHSDSPNHSKFIKVKDSPYDWRVGQNDKLWQSSKDFNNPCPRGFRVPTIDELKIETLSQGVKENFLKLPLAGSRDSYDGSLHGQGSYGLIWSSSLAGKDEWSLSLGDSGAYMHGGSRARALSVRCLKD